MNLTPLEIASRNLFAAVTGVSDPATVELAFLNPHLVRTIDETLTQAFSGPFGNIVPANFDDVHTCTAREGYVQALTEALNLRVGIVQCSSEEVATGIQIGQDAMLRGISDLLEAAQPVELEPELPLDGPSALAGMLSELFGFQVQVVSLEPTEG